MTGPVKADYQTTSDSSPPLTGVSTQVGGSVSVEIWTTDPTPVKVWGPSVYAVDSDGNWTVPDSDIARLYAEVDHQYEDDLRLQDALVADAYLPIPAVDAETERVIIQPISAEVVTQLESDSDYCGAEDDETCLFRPWIYTEYMTCQLPEYFTFRPYLSDRNVFNNWPGRVWDYFLQSWRHDTLPDPEYEILSRRNTRPIRASKFDNEKPVRGNPIWQLRACEYYRGTGYVEAMFPNSDTQVLEPHVFGFLYEFWMWYDPSPSFPLSHYIVKSERRLLLATNKVLDHMLTMPELNAPGGLDYKGLIDWLGTQDGIDNSSPYIDETWFAVPEEVRNDVSTLYMPSGWGSSFNGMLLGDCEETFGQVLCAYDPNWATPPATFSRCGSCYLVWSDYLRWHQEPHPDPYVWDWYCDETFRFGPGASSLEDNVLNTVPPDTGSIIETNWGLLPKSFHKIRHCRDDVPGSPPESPVNIESDTMSPYEVRVTSTVNGETYTSTSELVIAADTSQSVIDDSLELVVDDLAQQVVDD